MTRDPVIQHFFTGFMRLHILYHAAEEPIFGAEITEELIRHGYHVSQGTLYPTLHFLEELGYLSCRTKWVSGKRRKYYRATRLGRRVLAQAKEKLKELVGEVLEHKHAHLPKTQESDRRTHKRKTVP